MKIITINKMCKNHPFSLAQSLFSAMIRKQMEKVLMVFIVEGICDTDFQVGLEKHIMSAALY